MYDGLEVPLFADDASQYEAISKAWLRKLFEASIKEEVPPIDNRPLLCAHGMLALTVAKGICGGTAFKVIRREAAEELYALYGGGPRLAPLAAHYCAACVSATVELARLKTQLDGDDKAIKALGRRGPGKAKTLEEGGRQYLVGKESFKRWKALKMALVRAKHSGGVALEEEVERDAEEGASVTSSSGSSRKFFWIICFDFLSNFLSF